MRLGKMSGWILLRFATYVTFQFINRKTETNFLLCISFILLYAFMLFSNIKQTYFKSSEKREPNENITFSEDAWCFWKKYFMIFTKECFSCFSLLCLLNRFILCENFKCNFQGSHKIPLIDCACLTKNYLYLDYGIWLWQNSFKLSNLSTHLLCFTVAYIYIYIYIYIFFCSIFVFWVI